MSNKKQMKRKKLLGLGLAIGIGLFGMWHFTTSVFAAESITSMDEEGNMKNVDSSAKLIENPAGPNKSRTGEPQVVNFRTKNNAVTEFIEQETAKPGYTNGAYGADAVYLGYANGKYKFMLSGVVGWVKEDEVQVVNLSQAKAVSCYEVKDGKLMHHIVQDMTTPGYATSLNNGPAPSYLEQGVVYYSYDGHYFYKDYAVMVADYRQDVRTQSVNPQNPYYNYFQYLPLRSQSSYTGQEINAMLDETVKSDSKMKDTGEIFVSKQNTYGVHALLMAGIAANESNWGKSSISQQKNNLFGLNATDDSPGTSANKYGSVAACIEDFANGWMSRGYLYPNDYRYNGGFLGNKASGLNVKYASDPYWGEKAANIVWRLDSTMGGKDAGKYMLAAKEIIPKEHLSVNVRKEPAVSASLLYKTGKAANYVVLVRNQEATEGFYEIQSDAVLDSDRGKVLKGSGKYDFDKMYCYMSADYLTIVNSPEGSETQPPQEDTEEPVPTEKILDSIRISVPPSKTSYVEGESFDSTGLQVMAKWSDGVESDVTAQVRCQTEPLKTTDTEITIQYTYENVTKEAVQAITVTAKEQISLFVTPEAVEVAKGGTQQFGVEVKSETGTMPELVWTVLGNQSQQTGIDAAGMLTVGEDELADKLMIRVALATDPDTTADAVAVITKDQIPDSEVEQPQEEEQAEVPENTDQETTMQPPVTEEEESEQDITGQEITSQEVKGEETSASKKEKSVETGDETSILFWLLTGSIAGLAVILKAPGSGKKENL